MKDMMCSECDGGYFEHLRWTKGGDGSHWEGCEDVHWDCRIAQLEKEIARRDEIIARLKEDGERFEKRAIAYVYPDETPPYYECQLCFHDADEPDNILHDKSCPVTLHRALMKELEK